jgi:predicted dithiol-disulfide oxidoreductase (DUF899 family)
MSIQFSGESDDYRQARNRLLQAEISLRAEMERVASLRRQLPPGRAADPYVFQSDHGPVSLEKLFAPGRDTLVVYSYMFAPDAQAPCPMCSAYLDSLDGVLPHLLQRLSLAVVASAPLERLRAVARERGWRHLPLLSASGSEYQRDYHGEDADGRQLPMCNVFIRRDGQVHHFWCSEMFFADSPWHPRHVDLLFPLWNHLDLTPEGRGTFFPSLTYQE